MYRIFCSSLSFKVRILHWAQHTSAVHFPRTPLKRIHCIPRDKKQNKKTRPWLWKFLTFISFIHLARCFGGISRGCSFCCGMRKGQIQQCAEPRSSRAAQSSLYSAIDEWVWESCVPDTQGGECTVLVHERVFKKYRERDNNELLSTELFTFCSAETLCLCCCQEWIIIITAQSLLLVIITLFNWMQASICGNTLQ